MTIGSAKGFVFLELVITSAVLLVAITGLLFAFMGCLFLNDKNSELVTASHDTEYMLEQVKSLAYSAIDTYSPPSFANLGGETVIGPTVTQHSSRVKEVTVGIRWTDKHRRQRQFSLTTRIARH